MSGPQLLGWQRSLTRSQGDWWHFACSTLKLSGSVGAYFPLSPLSHRLWQASSWALLPPGAAVSGREGHAGRVRHCCAKIIQSVSSDWATALGPMGSNSKPMSHKLVSCWLQNFHLMRMELWLELSIGRFEALFAKIRILARYIDSIRGKRYTASTLNKYC